jgi:uncharacterized protein YndB with AHSA1/START domain
MTPQIETNPWSSDDIVVNKTVHINAPAVRVWEALTNRESMKKWMADSETEINIITDWKVGSPMIIRGTLHRVKFENKGTVLQFEREKILQYNHLSSISRLPNIPESYTILEFHLTPVNSQTELTFMARNFPTETIYKHFRFYWNVTLELLKKMIEGEGSS